MTADPESLLAIFDHDGVLVDSFGFHEQAWLELERRTQLGFTPEFIHQTFGMTNPSIFRRLLGEQLSDDEVGGIADLKEECYRDVARGSHSAARRHARVARRAHRPGRQARDRLERPARQSRAEPSATAGSSGGSRRLPRSKTSLAASPTPRCS